MSALTGATRLPGAHGEVRPWTEIDRLEHLKVDRLHQQELDRRRQQQQLQDADRLQHLQELQVLDPQQQEELDRRLQQQQQQRDADQLQQLLQQLEQDADRIRQLQQLLNPQQPQQFDRHLLEQELNERRQQQQQQQEVVVRFNEYNSEPLNQTKNLMWIEQNPLYKTALKDWDRTAKLLTERVDRMEKRSGDLKNEIYQLVGFFTVLQGVVLTAVTQMTQSSPQATCKKVWSPVLLTGLAWFVTSVGVGLKLKPIVAIDMRRKMEDADRKVVVSRAQRLRSQGPKFLFGAMKEKKTCNPPNYFLRYFAMIVMALSVFTGVFIASYFLILCNRGLAPITYAPFN